jgi:hypothetical protein
MLFRRAVFVHSNSEVVPRSTVARVIVMLQIGTMHLHLFIKFLLDFTGIVFAFLCVDCDPV